MNIPDDPEEAASLQAADQFEQMAQEIRRMDGEIESLKAKLAESEAKRRHLVLALDGLTGAALQSLGGMCADHKKSVVPKDDPAGCFYCVQSKLAATEERLREAEVDAQHHAANRKEAEAQAAAMREALERVGIRGALSCGEAADRSKLNADQHASQCFVESALGCHAGRALLERLDKLEAQNAALLKLDETVRGHVRQTGPFKIILSEEMKRAIAGVNVAFRPPDTAPQANAALDAKAPGDRRDGR